MPPQQSKQPDFIPAASPDFIPAEQLTSAPEQPQGNALQRAFDNLTTVTPEQEQGHSAPVNALQHVGAGVMQLASPLVHPLNAMEKAGDTLMHPHDTLNETIQGVKEHPWETVGNVLGGAALGGVAGEVGPKVLEKVPTRAKAGAIFNSLNEDLANQPVKLNQTAQPLQRVTEIGERGGTLPTPVSKFLQRSQSPLETDMTFPEARDYQSNLAALTRNSPGMEGPMRGGVKQLNKAYFQDMKDAAGPYGEDYQKAMTMNRRANQLNSMATSVGKHVGKVAGTAALGGAGYGLLKAFQGDR